MLSNITNWLQIPSNLIAVLAVLGLVALVLRRPRWGRGLLAVATLLFMIGGWTPLGPWLLELLEERFPRPITDVAPAGLILLGGAVDTHISLSRGAVVLNDGGERLVETAALSRVFPNARIFLSGGAGPHEAGARTESALARDQLIALGVPEARIELEERSLTTCQNASESAASIRPTPDEGWLLITSAYHMPRAVACFRAAGFDVIPYPVDYRTGSGGGSLSMANGLQSLDLAVHEWIGLITHRLFGMTAEVFPAPMSGTKQNAGA